MTFSLCVLGTHLTFPLKCDICIVIWQDVWKRNLIKLCFLVFCSLKYKCQQEEQKSSTNNTSNSPCKIVIDAVASTIFVPAIPSVCRQSGSLAGCRIKLYAWKSQSICTVCLLITNSSALCVAVTVICLTGMQNDLLKTYLSNSTMKCDNNDTWYQNNITWEKPNVPTDRDC